VVEIRQCEKRITEHISHTEDSVIAISVPQKINNRNLCFQRLCAGRLVWAGGKTYR
jgi:hypothetical protein